MKIKIANIDVGNYTVREKIDDEYVKEILESFKLDGQWNPIIVRPKGDGSYELIAGHYRLQAAKELGWIEIEATVKDVSDEDADFLSLKTNIIRKSMDEIEEARVIKKIMDKYELTQKKIAEKIGRSPPWVSARLSLVLRVSEKVQDALSRGVVSADHVNLISTISEEKYKTWEAKQNLFLDFIIKNKWSRDKARSQLKNLLNDTLYTIGYQGKNSSDFIEILKNNKIKILVDVRHSAKSERVPAFSKDILKRELERNKIAYQHFPELGIPFLIQAPYKEGKFSIDCLKQWYSWNIENNVDFPNFIKSLKNSGRPVLMCMERYAKKMRDQKYACHRDILTNKILNFTTIDPLLKFENRIDL